MTDPMSIHQFRLHSFQISAHISGYPTFLNPNLFMNVEQTHWGKNTSSPERGKLVVRPTTFCVPPTHTHAQAEHQALSWLHAAALWPEKTHSSRNDKAS